MKPLTVEELQQILDTIGLTKNAVEKQFKMGQGSIGKFLKGSLKSLPDKYVAKIRKLGKDAEEKKRIGVELVNIEMESLKGFPTDLKPVEHLDMRPVNPLIPEVKHLDERDNPFTNAARGRDENGTNNDEIVNSDKQNDELKLKRPLINKDLLP